KRRFFWNHTRFGIARFRSRVTGGAVLGLYLVNVLLLIATLGLAWPWVRVRNIRFAFRYLALEGPLELERIEQEAQVASATGEGLAGFRVPGFDLGWCAGSCCTASPIHVPPVDDSVPPSAPTARLMPGALPPPVRCS